MRSRERGMTYLELIATAAILMVLASAILPVGRVAHRRTQEIELRRALRDIRTAINAYKQMYDDQKFSLELGSTGYPPDLERLVEGEGLVGTLGKKMKLLRRIPVDPMTGEADWGLRCYQDEPDSTSWCGDDVWDVYSKSTAKALDGTSYASW